MRHQSEERDDQKSFMSPSNGRQLMEQDIISN